MNQDEKPYPLKKEEEEKPQYISIKINVIKKDLTRNKRSKKKRKKKGQDRAEKIK